MQYTYKDYERALSLGEYVPVITIPLVSDLRPTYLRGPYNDMPLGPMGGDKYMLVEFEWLQPQSHYWGMLRYLRQAFVPTRMHADHYNDHYYVFAECFPFLASRANRVEPQGGVAW